MSDVCVDRQRLIEKYSPISDCKLADLVGRKPPRHLSHRAMPVAAIALLCTVLLPAGAALAREARAPHETRVRIGNIWDGFDHQPTEFQVRSAERARGVAPSAQERSREAQIVRRLSQELLTNAGVDITSAAAG